MKKIQITIAFLLLTLLSHGQFFIGKTMEEIKIQLAIDLKEYKIKTEVNKAGQNVLIYEDLKSDVTKYTFDSKNICQFTVVIPQTTDFKNGLYDLFNKNAHFFKSKMGDAWLADDDGTHLVILYQEDSKFGYFFIKEQKEHK